MAKQYKEDLKQVPSPVIQSLPAIWCKRLCNFLMAARKCV